MDQRSVVQVVCLILALLLVSTLAAYASDRTRSLLQRRSHVELPVAFVQEPRNTRPEQTIQLLRNAVLTYLNRRFGHWIQLVQNLTAHANSDDLQLRATPPLAHAGQAGIATDTQATNTLPNHIIVQPPPVLSRRLEKSPGDHLVLGTALGKTLSFVRTAATVSGKTITGVFSRTLPARELSGATSRLPISMDSIPPVAGY